MSRDASAPMSHRHWSNRACETYDAFLRRRVARLPQVAEARLGRGVHDDAAFVFAKNHRGRTDSREGALHMHRNDVVPIALTHIVDDARAHDAGVVDENVETPETIERGLNDARVRST